MRDRSSENVTPIGMPILTGISRVTFSVASSIIEDDALVGADVHRAVPADGAGLARPARVRRGHGIAAPQTSSDAAPRRRRAARPQRDVTSALTGR